MADVSVGLALHAVSVTGGEARAISTPFYLANLVDISPDGSELLVQSYEGTVPEGPLWIYPALAGPRHRLGDLVSSSAAWSPDGQRRLAYSKGTALHIARSDGTDSRHSRPSAARRSGCVGQPDARKLRFTVQVAGGGSSTLWEVATDGTPKKDPMKLSTAQAFASSVRMRWVQAPSSR